MSADDFDLQRMLESKRAFRQQLAARPLAEKLHLLDELRERALVIRRASLSHTSAPAHAVNEHQAEFGDDRPR